MYLRHSKRSTMVVKISSLTSMRVKSRQDSEPFLPPDTPASISDAAPRASFLERILAT